jgi:hypothetical protein
LNTTLLLQKLIQIENVVGILEPVEVRRMLIEVEDYLLETQRSSVDRSAANHRTNPGSVLRAVTRFAL